MSLFGILNTSVCRLMFVSCRDQAFIIWIGMICRKQCWGFVQIKRLVQGCSKESGAQNPAQAGCYQVRNLHVFPSVHPSIQVQWWLMIWEQWPGAAFVISGHLAVYCGCWTGWSSFEVIDLTYLWQVAEWHNVFTFHYLHDLLGQEDI